MKYRCEHCYYIYDEKFGEPDCDILPQTKLIDTPFDFECPLCHTGKDAFVKLDKNYFSILS